MTKFILKLSAALSLLALPFAASAQTDAFPTDLSPAYYLPSEITTFDAGVPSPKDYLGYEIGERLVTPEQVLGYCRALAAASPRVKIVERGRTYEMNPLYHLVISSKENMNSLVEIQRKQQRLADPEKSAGLDFETMPLVNWMGYSVHGNEASGINGAMMVAYALAASTDPYVTGILARMVVIMHPAQNPDGAGKYANWINWNGSFVLDPDGQNRAIRPIAPSGRSNHYWFDLNRDWLVAQHPESYYKLDVIHEWMPTMANDFHEQGAATRGTFFSPGRKGSVNLVLPQNIWALTEKLAKYHGEYLDRIGSPHYYGRGYDTYYAGKGAAYPAFMGGIASLYEQPNAGGMYRTNTKGFTTSMPQQIRNAVYCSFSTLAGGVALKREYQEYQRQFYIDKYKEAEASAVKGYVFGSESDRSLNMEMARVLLNSRIEFYHLAKDIKQNGVSFSRASSFVVPVQQRNSALVRTIFERATEFVDTTFYDTSTWTLPLALNIPCEELSSTEGLLGKTPNNVFFDFNWKYSVDYKPSYEKEWVSGIPGAGIICRVIHSPSPYAYIFEPDDYYSYKYIYYLLEKGVKLYAARAEFSADTESGTRKFAPGTIVVPVEGQAMDKNALEKILNAYKNEDAVGFIKTVNSKYISEFQRQVLDGGLVAVYAAEKDFMKKSAQDFQEITLPRIALITGRGMDLEQVGEIWHQLDFRFRMKVTMMDAEILAGDPKLDAYNIIIVTAGVNLSKAASAKLAQWSKSNTLIAVEKGSAFTNKLGLTDISKTRGGNARGVILSTELNRNSPLAYGVKSATLPVFRNGREVTNAAKGDAAVAVYSGSPVLSGYWRDNGDSAFKGRPSVMAGGNVVYFADDPCFRAYWFGTSRLLMNAIFYRELLPQTKIVTN